MRTIAATRQTNRAARFFCCTNRMIVYQKKENGGNSAERTPLKGGDQEVVRFITEEPAIGAVIAMA